MKIVFIFDAIRILHLCELHLTLRLFGSKESGIYIGYCELKGAIISLRKSIDEDRAIDQFV